MSSVFQGVKILTFGPSYHTLDFQTSFFEKNAEKTKSKTGIAIENSTSMKSVEETVLIHDTLKADGYDVCYCLDVGHCHLNKKYENDIPSVVRLLGSRLKMLHLHDNCRNKDLHAVPFAGTIPWEETMIALKEIGYDGDFNPELDFNRVPQPLLKPYPEYSLQVARYLMSVFDGAERSLDLENKV